MSSLASCIKKAGKALSAEDVDAVRAIHDDLVAAGVENPAQAAIDELLQIKSIERSIIVDQIQEQGGRIGKDIVLAKPTVQTIAEKIAITDVLSQEEVLELAEGKYSIVKSGPRKGLVKTTKRTLYRALVARMKKANRGRTLEARTQRSKDIISEVLAMEAIAASERTGNAADWYSTVLTNAVNVAAEIHPELKTDVNARTMFLLGVAIMSNGQTVAMNTKLAEEIYAGYKKTGKFPLLQAPGSQGSATVDHQKLANTLIERWGIDQFVWFLNAEFTIGELTAMDFDMGAENVDTATNGSAIFGPKIGGGFFQNLMGNFNPITMDRWFMSTWGRIVGNAVTEAGYVPEAQAASFAEEVRANPEKVERLGFSVDEVLQDDKKLLELAAAAHRAYAKSSGVTKTYGDKTSFNKKAKGLDEASKEVVIAPRNGDERTWIREVTQLAIEKMQQRGYPANAASLQALIWYPEKELNLIHGVGNAKSAPTDYEQEFVKLALERGISQKRIDAARSGGDQRKRAAGTTRRGDGDPEQTAQQVADEKTESAKRKSLLRFEALRALRGRISNPYRGTAPKGRDRVLEDAPVLSVFKPQIVTRNVFNKIGLPNIEVKELQASEIGAALFHKKITDAASANKDGAAVYIYPREDYENMRMFLAEDGLAGFALKGDDIVSVFKHPDSKTKNIGQALIAAAVSEGGRRLDAFDTILPHMYSMQGFRVVARVGWNEDYKPETWDKEHFSDWNNGEPDVVYMVYDPGHPHMYTGRNEGQRYKTPRGAENKQASEVAALQERTKKAPQVLYALPEKSQQRINNEPTHPLSQLHKLGATVEEQGHLPPLNMAMNTIRELMDRVGPKTLLAAIPRRYLLDFMPAELAPSLNRYLQQANRLSGRRNELQTEYEDTARTWAQWARKNHREAGILSELMHASTLAGVDPEKPYKPLKNPENMSDADKKTDMLRREQYQMLRDVWETLPTEAHGIYTDVRDSYIKMRERVEKGLEARIMASAADGKTKKAMLDELRAKWESGRVKGVYFPLMRYGDYYAAAKDENGEVVSFSRFENKKDMQQWAKEFRDTGYEVSWGLRSEEREQQFDKIDPKFAARVAEMAKDMGDASMVDEIWQMYLRSLPEMSMRKRFLHRKGRLGFAADGLRAYANVAFRSANQQAKLEHMHKMEDSLESLFEEMDKVQNDPELSKEFNWAMPLYDEMQRRHESMKNPDSSGLTVKITGAGFLWFLGFTPAAALVNLTQTPLVAFPVLSAEFSIAGAAGEIARAATLFAGSRGNLENRLRGEERDALMEAKRIGLFEKTQAHDLAGLTEGAGLGAYNTWQHRFMEIGSWMFHMAEVMNREVTFLAGYRLARRRGDSHEDAILLAEDLTWDSHFDYNNANRPIFMQKNMGRVIFLFKQYSLNMTYRLMRDFRDGVMRNPDISKKERNKAAQRFVGMMGMAGVMAGYSGLPSLITMPVEMIAEALLGDEDEPIDARDALRAYLAELYGEEAAEWIMKGAVDGGMGLTLSNRVSLGQLWWRDQNVNTDGETAMQRILFDMLGPIVSTGVQGAGTAYDFVKGDVDHPERGIEKMIPKALRDLARTYRYSTEGALTQHVPQDVLVRREDFDTIDLGWQALGFTPARLTMQYEQNQALRNMEDRLMQQRARRINAYMIAMFNDDKKGVQEAWAGISKWNAAQPSFPITGDTIRSAAQNRMRRNFMNRGGVNLNQRLWHLYDDLSFTPDERAPVPEEENQ
jgi:hypothetical protein